MTTEELIEYIYSTDFEDIKFEIDGDLRIKGKRTIILLYRFGSSYRSRIKEKFGDQVQLNNITPLTAIETIEKIQEYLGETSKSKATVDSISNNTTESSVVGKNLLYFGAPGTGKSYAVSQEIREIYPNFDKFNDSESAFVFRTTLHPEYSYSDFVGQIMPTTDEGQNAKFIENLGIFTQALKMAIASPNQHIFLILEEMSRANVAAVFGDLFQLLDRNKNGDSEYHVNNAFIAKSIYSEPNAESKKIYIPNNLSIIGTVNTSDQNVFAMDTAFKRRFEMIYTSIDAPDNFEDWYFKYAGQDISWNTFRINLNQFITKEMKLSEDKQLGAFFISKCVDPEVQIQNKLLNYLWEDVEKSSIFNSEKSLFADEYKDGNFSEIYFAFQKNKAIFNPEIIAVNQDDQDEDK